MCSSAARRIAEIGQAIDDLAVTASRGAKAVAMGEAAGSAASTEAATGDTDPVVARLAELWALLAELDPEMARRVAGYQGLTALTDLWPAGHWWNPSDSKGNRIHRLAI